MAANSIYRIKILNWEKHNPKRKKHYKYTLISNNLIHDGQLRTLPVSVRWLWINLLLTAGDLSRDTVEISERQLRDMLESSWSISRALDAFQSFQMVTWEIVKVTPPPNRIEENRIEENRIEGKTVSKKTKQVTQGLPAVANPSASPPKVNLVIARYCELWKDRYGGDAPISGKVAGQIKLLIKDHGEIKALSYVEAYLAMPDPWFITKRHDVGTLMLNLNPIAQFMATGKIYSKQEIQNVDKAIGTKNLLDMIEAGEI